jgi:hypothetical protein
LRCHAVGEGEPLLAADPLDRRRAVSGVAYFW